MYDNLNAPRCKSAKEANLTMTILTEALNEYRIAVLGCPVPCNQTFYQLEHTLFHQNSYLVILNEDATLTQNDNDLSELIVSAFFRSLVVEEHVETVVYDMINLLSAAGGNLGLLLGFSCLSTLLYSHDLIVRKLFG